MSVAEGPLVIADIAGYGRYLGGVELEHSSDILADLMGLVVEQLSGVLSVAKLEGDAVFCVGDSATDADGLLTAIESCYFAFARRRRTIDVATTCECDACRRIPELDLKFVAHHGEFAEHDVAGHRELVGPDVVAVHRLLKNSVGERTGAPAYLFATDALLGSLAIDAVGLELVPHSESYEDVGAVSGGVLDLGARWADEQERAEVIVSPGEEDFAFEAVVDIPVARMWVIATDPRQQLRWRVAIDRYEMDNRGGSRGVGSVSHCVHGKEVIEQEILDWKPHRYFSYREKNPAGWCLWTVSMEPAGDSTDEPQGTRLIWRLRLTGGMGQRALMLVMRRRMQRVLSENFESLVRYAGSAAERHPILGISG